MEKKTCLYDRHVALGALMSPFGGFIMPIQYTNITDEHNAVRQHCGVFDVSHMGEVRITGPDAEKYVQHIFTNDVAGAPVGQIYYGMMLYPNGGTVDDLLVYKMGENDFFLVINAANIDKDVAWMKEHTAGFDINLDHQSDYYGQLAVQGPEAETVVEEVLGIPCETITGYGDGSDHAWNRVAVNGVWLYIDVTWDDPVCDISDRYVRYDYFGLDDEQFERNHQPDKNRYMYYPGANSTRADYYVVNELVCDDGREADTTMKKAVDIAVKRNEGYARIKCTDKDAYVHAYEKLFSTDEGTSRMFGLLNEVFSETGRDDAVSYSIIKNDEVYTITVRFMK